MRIRIGLLGLAAATIIGCNKPSDYDGDGFTADVDCNDNDANINPDAVEVCDGVDNNCDASIDGEDADGALTFYADLDGDGYGNETIVATQCDMPSGYVDNADDCDDNDAALNPDGAEVCDGLDNDCDGLVDDADDSVDTAGFSTYYADADGDGYGNPDTSADGCDAPSGFTDNGDDCDDTDGTVNPDSVWYSDVDGDGYGSESFSTTGCEQPDGYVGNTEDCDDISAAVNPDAQEVCDGEVDNDCDGLADDADDSVDASTFTTYYADGDTDGYGDAATSVTQCTMPSGYVADDTDCDDAEILANPGETEVCNDGIDNDCSGDAPECGLPQAGSVADASMTLTSYNADVGYLGQFGMTSGDFNGDGNTDLAVTDYSAYVGSDYSAGTVEFFYGPLSTVSSSVLATGKESGEYFGYNVANMGDVDGDGADELAVGGKYSGDGCYKCGAAYIIDGPTSNSYGSDLALMTVNGDSTYSYFGEGVANLGDINGDGYAEVAFGAAGVDSYGYSNGGAVYVYFGASSIASSTADLSDADITFYGDTYYDYIGDTKNISGLGDLDGDGYADVGLSTAGNDAVYIFYGASSLSGVTATSTADAKLTDVNYFGYTIAGLGDLDGDGYDDFAVGDYGDYEVAIYTGGATRLVSGDSESFNVTDSSSSYNYLYNTPPVTGDFNGDGHLDLTVGDYYYGDPNGNGAVSTFYGPLSTGADLDVSARDSHLTGDTTSGTYNYFGAALYTMDADGDGADDLLVNDATKDSVYIFGGGSL